MYQRLWAQTAIKQRVQPSSKVPGCSPGNTHLQITSKVFVPLDLPPASLESDLGSPLTLFLGFEIAYSGLAGCFWTDSSSGLHGYRYARCNRTYPPVSYFLFGMVTIRNPNPLRRVAKRGCEKTSTYFHTFDQS